MTAILMGVLALIVGCGPGDSAEPPEQTTTTMTQTTSAPDPTQPEDAPGPPEEEDEEEVEPDEPPATGSGSVDDWCEAMDDMEPFGDTDAFIDDEDEDQEFDLVALAEARAVLAQHRGQLLNSAPAEIRSETADFVGLIEFIIDTAESVAAAGGDGFDLDDAMEDAMEDAMDTNPEVLRMFDSSLTVYQFAFDNCRGG